MHVDLDPKSPEAQRAAELARELLGARLARCAGVEVDVGQVFVDAILELRQNDRLGAYLLAAQTALTALVLDCYTADCRRGGWDGTASDLFAFIALGTAARGLTI